MGPDTSAKFSPSREQRNADAPPAVREIALSTISNPLGNLTFVEAEKRLPFSIKRAYYVYDIPEHATRGGHANKTNHAFIVAVAGAFTITVEAQDGKTLRRRLDNPAVGIYHPPLHWIVMNEFAPGTVCLVLASHNYDPADYLRDYNAFRTFR